MFTSTRARRRVATQTEVELTPLIDMVFILLIFFLVTTSFVPETGLRIDRPRSSTADSLPRDSVSIAIGTDGRITLAGREVGLFAIRPYLERRLRNRPELAAVIIADRTVPADRIVRIMDEVRAAGIANMALATETEE